MYLKQFLILFIIIFSNHGISQNYLIKYNAKLQLYDLNSETAEKLSSLEKEYLKNINDKKKYLSKVVTVKVLSNSNNYRLFYDDIMLIDGYNNNDYNMAKLNISTFPEIYYSEGISYGKSSTLENILVSASIKDYFKWKITAEKKYILNFLCYKAYPVINENITKPDGVFIPKEVWFSAELNLKSSPGMFTDLPGAILEYKTDMATITATEINESNKAIKSFNLDNYNLLDYKEYNVRIKKHFEKIRSNFK